MAVNVKKIEPDSAFAGMIPALLELSGMKLSGVCDALKGQYNIAHPNGVGNGRPSISKP
jgi:hypothetical protein